MFHKKALQGNPPVQFTVDVRLKLDRKIWIPKHTQENNPKKILKVVVELEMRQACYSYDFGMLEEEDSEVSTVST